MISIYFCPQTNEWEKDYISELFGNSEKFKIVNYSPWEMVSQINDKNILIINHYINLINTKYLLMTLKPFLIFHLSDEAGTDGPYYQLYYENRDVIKFLYHQYFHHRVDYKLPHAQLPLGFVSGLRPSCNKTDLAIMLTNIKTFDFSFVGELKSDRLQMIEIFQDRLKNNYIKTSKTNWSNSKEQAVSPNTLGLIYSKSWFVPVGRGNITIDCFRIYEAIVSCAIPVLVASYTEIASCFQFQDKSFQLVSADNWADACIQCESLLNDPNAMIKIIENNINWWNNMNAIIIRTIDNHL